MKPHTFKHLREAVEYARATAEYYEDTDPMNNLTPQQQAQANVYAKRAQRALEAGDLDAFEAYTQQELEIYGTSDEPTDELVEAFGELV